MTRSRGQQYQARSALLPQVSTSLNYQKQLQNQFQAITERFGAGGGDTAGNGGGDIAENPITRIFASPYTVTYAPAGQPADLHRRARRAPACAAARCGRAVLRARRHSAPGAGPARRHAGLLRRRARRAPRRDRRVHARAVRAYAAAGAAHLRRGQHVGVRADPRLASPATTSDPPYLQSRTQRDLALLRLKQLLDLPLDRAAHAHEPHSGSAGGDRRPVAWRAPSLTVSRDDVIVRDDPRVQAAVDDGAGDGRHRSSAVRLPVQQAALGVEAAHAAAQVHAGAALAADRRSPPPTSASPTPTTACRARSATSSPTGRSGWGVSRSALHRRPREGRDPGRRG